MIEWPENFGAYGWSAAGCCAAALALIFIFSHSRQRAPAYFFALSLAAASVVLGQLHSRKVLDLKVGTVTMLAASDASKISVSMDEFVQASRTAQKPQSVAKEKAQAAPPPAVVAPARPASVLTAAQLANAKRLARWNLLACVLALAVALLAALWDYALDFNVAIRKGWGPPPLPLAGWLIDRVSPKAYAVRLNGDSRVAERFLDRAIRKGETFIYMGEHGADRTFYRFSLAGLKLGRVKSIEFDAHDTVPEEAALLEPVWSGRAVCRIRDEAFARQLLPRLVRFLKLCQTTGTALNRTVNIVWDFPAPPDAPLEPLAAACRAVNCRLAVRTDNPALRLR